MRNFIVLLMLLSFVSCDYFSTSKEEKSTAVARVMDIYLYQKDIKKVMPFNMSKTDSTLFVQNYIDSWVRRTLLMEKAKINATINPVELEQLVQKYKEDLLINSYQKSVVSEYLDTTITDSDISEYYQQNKDKFKLNDDLVQLKYVKFPKKVLNKKEFIKLFKSKKEEDLDTLISKEYAFKEFHLRDSSWVTYADVMNKIPILLSFNKRDLLKNTTFVKKEDSLDVYLVRINGVRLKSQVAPKDFVKETIRELILHERKKILLRDIELKIMEDAKTQKQIEINKK
ncbi:MAG: hypothetical protein KGV44_02755 [Flavobacteriaceae bacterium]|nr:hypothetical protein [Flavobacteriaceae bacterium]